MVDITEQLAEMGRLFDEADIPTKGRYYRYMDDEGVIHEVQLDDLEA